MVAEETLVEIVEMVWKVMLGEDVHRLSAGLARQDPSPQVVGTVRIVGDWDGAVQLRLSRAGAEQAASIIYGEALEQVDVDMIADAVGELTNMVAGNYKALLNADNTLSMPEVTTETVPAKARPDDIESELWMSWEGRPVNVRILHH